MTRIEGQIKTVRQHGGCVEITVDGPLSGTFTMDNCCAENLFANEGPDLVGRSIEYQDGYVRFFQGKTSPKKNGTRRTTSPQEWLQRAVLAPLRHLRRWESVKVFSNGKVRIKFKDHAVKIIPAPSSRR